MKKSADYEVHIVGSVPMRDATEVFTTLAHILGPSLSRIPDGETGERLSWSKWMEPAFALEGCFFKSGQLFPVDDKPGDPPVAKYEMKDGVSPQNATFEQLPIARHAIDSYREFRRLRDAGVVPAKCRYQVALAPGHIVVWRWFRDELHAVLEPIYNNALGREIQNMLKVIPASDLSIQWDIASRVFARLEWGHPSRYGQTKEEMFETFTADAVALGELVPEPVELLYHFCYGDTGHKHTVQPSSTADMVEMANRISGRIARGIQLIHMPVPRDRSDDAYFQPLSKLRTSPST